MPTPLPDYYAVLGLKPAATPAEIKRRYRELARKYHPDVNHSPEAAHRIKVVNEAHRVLGDPDRKSQYDAERVLDPASRAAASYRAQNGQRSDARGTRSGPQPSGSKVEFNGFGRETAHSTYQSRPPTSSPRASRAAGSSAAAARLVTEAQVALLTRNYTEAARLCREALNLDRTSAGAHEVLGDIHAIRGDADSAIKNYSYAIQYNPRSYSAQGKLDRMVGRRPAAGRVVNARAGRNLVPSLGGFSREILMGAISLGLFSTGCAVVAIIAQNPGVPIGGAIPWVTSLSINMLIALFIEGVIGGILMAFYGRLWPIKQELASESGRRTGKKAPLLVILTLFSVAWFYASLIVYICVGVARHRISISTVRMYTVALGLVALFTVISAAGDRGWLETAAFAGNVLFPGVMLGWYLGDLVRLRAHGV